MDLEEFKEIILIGIGILTGLFYIELSAIAHLHLRLVANIYLLIITFIVIYMLPTKD